MKQSVLRLFAWFGIDGEIDYVPFETKIGLEADVFIPESGVI